MTYVLAPGVVGELSGASVVKRSRSRECRKIRFRFLPVIPPIIRASTARASIWQAVVGDAPSLSVTNTTVTMGCSAKRSTRAGPYEPSPGSEVMRRLDSWRLVTAWAVEVASSAVMPSSSSTKALKRPSTLEAVGNQRGSAVLGIVAQHDTEKFAIDFGQMDAGVQGVGADHFEQCKRAACTGRPRNHGIPWVSA